MLIPSSRPQLTFKDSCRLPNRYVKYELGYLLEKEPSIDVVLLVYRILGYNQANFLDAVYWTMNLL
jgi:hypothetical protein